MMMVTPPRNGSVLEAGIVSSMYSHWGQKPTHLDSRCLRGMWSEGSNVE
jgi:hypothetical protein